MKEKSWLRKLLNKKIILGSTVGAALFFMLLGVIFWGGFNWSVEATNTEQFCISCHEMEDYVYQEYKETIHYSNRSGVRAVCSDCHVPDDWIHKIPRKIRASRELWHKMLGTIDTREKFEAKRLELAKNEWARMKESNSRECRNCHNFEYMHINSQESRAAKQHLMALQEGNTCIDCHKGIAHKDVRHMLSEEELEKLEAPDPELARPNATLHQFQRDIDAAEKAEAEEAAAREQQIAEAKRKAEEAARLAAEQGKELKQTVNWGLAPVREVILFYPGTSSIEWIFGREHGGSRAFSKGERCVGCHEKEAADMGERMVTGEKLEPNVIPGKRGSIPVQIQAAHDGEHLYMRFSWPDTDHAPAPFVEGGKMDPDNKVKLAMMFGTDDVEFAEGAGCWASCHADSRDMPGEVDNAAIQAYAESGRLDATEGITKYLEESRTEIEYKGRRGKELGGWDKLKPEAEIQAAMQDDNFLDLLRYQIGTDTVQDGHVLAERNMDGGQGAEFTAELEEGVWTVEMKRKLKSDSAGDLSLDLSRVYNIGFAIHDDYSDSRYHHISLGYRLGFDNESEDIEINAIKL